jgi:hypothetical protein
MTPYPPIRYSNTVYHGMHAGWSQRLSTASALAIATGLIEVDAATVATSPTVVGPLNEMTKYDEPAPTDKPLLSNRVSLKRPSSRCAEPALAPAKDLARGALSR